MTVRRLYLPPETLRPGTLTIAGDSHHYIGRVVRARAGDRIVLFDGQGHQADAEIIAIDTDRATLRVADIRTADPPACPITVALPLIKGERMDACVQKLVELGVAAIAPVLTERTVVRVTGPRARKRRQRYRDIAIGAARQSQRAFVPDIATIVTLPELLRTRRPASHECLQLVLAPDVHGPGEPLRQALTGPPPAAVCVLIGPEGGLTDAEVQAAQASGFRPVALGPHILRADTAAIAGVVAIKYVFADIAS